MSRTVTVRYSDGLEKEMLVQQGQTILDAAESNGVAIVNECQSGVCGTCVGDCVSGDYDLGRTEGLSDQEREMGKVLTCQTEVKSDCVIELQYPSDANAAKLAVGQAIIKSIDLISDTTAILKLDVSSFPEELTYKSGQFAQIQVPGTTEWRNYSYANFNHENGELEFIIRLLPDGVMSNYLRSRAKPGDSVNLRGSKGSFYLRKVSRPLVLIAGGTGLAAIMPIVEELVECDTPHSFRLFYGVSKFEDLCKVDELEKLSNQCANFEYEVIVGESHDDWSGPTGVVTDLLDQFKFDGGDFDLYLCGPPPMVEASRNWLRENRFTRANLYYEKFLPSGGTTKSKDTVQLDHRALNLGAIKKEGKGTAVVMGGSVAGIVTAKILSEKFEKVVVLEKDGGHNPREGRPGAAQGWHLHHLLLGGQREIETVFPGIINEMVEAGAFKVDMAEQYRLYMAGSWKKVCKSGIDIVCAGRPLLEWCLRRRLDDIPNIDYKYDAEIQDLVYDSDENRILGVAVDMDGELIVLPAEFVVDATGKNTPVPRILDRLGVGSPEVERDNINCFYSTMFHEVPPEKRWDDKVMIICYAYRPVEEHYSAQFYLDSSRSRLCTSLVGYNCYSPPRNDKEFYEFSKRMPNSVMTKNLDGLKPDSEVHNFRYPDMMRLKYEKMANLPAGLIALGDSYTSADPVSGAGMTKALLELRELRSVLDRYDVTSHVFVKKYYKKISKIADLVWFVIREQNLRYSWIKDVKKKRPFYFSMLTWYMDRVTELIHDDLDAYRKFLSVVHFSSKPTSLMTPLFAGKVLSKWLWTKMRFKKSLIDENFSNGNLGSYNEEAP